MNDIEKYLRDNRPDTPAEDSFLIEMNARLNDVEGIKSTVDSERRRGRIALVAALVVGLVAGALLSAVVLLHPTLPADIADSSGNLIFRITVLLQPWKYYLPIPVAGFAIALGLLALNRKKSVL